MRWKGRRTPAYADGKTRKVSNCLHHHICSCILSLQESVSGSWSSWQLLFLYVSMSWCTQWSHHLPPSQLEIWLITVARMPDIPCINLLKSWEEKNKRLDLFAEVLISNTWRRCAEDTWSPAFWAFLFCPLDDDFQALVHGAPVGTGNNPQDHFDSVFFSYRLDGVGAESSLGNCPAWQLCVGLSVWKLPPPTPPALYSEGPYLVGNTWYLYSCLPLSSEKRVSRDGRRKAQLL